MLSDSAVANDRPPVQSTKSGACGAAAAAFYSSGQYTQIQKAVDLAAIASDLVAPSIAPEMWAAPDGEEQALYRLLLDEVESVNRLYKVVSQVGCDVVFYSESGELTGHYGKPWLERSRLPAPARSNELHDGFATARGLVRSSRSRAPAGALASPIFDPDGSFIGSLGLSPAAGECTGGAAALMQMLVRMAAHAVEERAFRKRYAREWIVALASPDEDAGVLLAVDRDHRVVGADRRARTTLLQRAGDVLPVGLWSLFEKDAAIFRSPHGGDVPVVLTRLDTAESWSALITPPAADRARIPANFDLSARPRLDLLGCSSSPRTVAASRGGLAPRALRRVRDYIDDHLADTIRLEALADVAGLSRCHFARAFKQSVGTSPHAYLMQRRLERAEQLLAETDFSLCRVALDSGFADQSHFSSCFRRHFGMSPRSFRRSQR
jgi:AraC-like DNA-binding protein